MGARAELCSHRCLMAVQAPGLQAGEEGGRTEEEGGGVGLGEGSPAREGSGAGWRGLRSQPQGDSALACVP